VTGALKAVIFGHNPEPRWPTPPARLCAHGDHTGLLPELRNDAPERRRLARRQ